MRNHFSPGIRIAWIPEAWFRALRNGGRDMLNFVCGVTFGVFSTAIAYVVWYVLSDEKEQDDVC